MNLTDTQVVRIRLEGPLVRSTSESLNALLRPAQGADVVILDLSGATCLDASALGRLVSLKHDLLARGGGRVHLVGVRENVRETFSVTGLDKHFEFREGAPPGNRS